MPGRLAATLAARGAGNPEALASFIANRATTGQRVLGFAAGGGGLDDEGSVMTCPNCGYTGRDFSGGAGGARTGGQDEALRTPAPDSGYVRSGAPLTVSSNVSAPGLANPAGGIDLATPRYPVTTAQDVLIRQRQGGGAEIRHRRGGTLIGEIVNDGAWKMLYDGRQGRGHPSSRAALAELVSTWNTGTSSLSRPAAGLQPPPAQTPLMEKFGVPAVRALATPDTSSSSGPRTTVAAGSGDDDGGLTPKGKAIKAKLVAKGWDDAKATVFARRAQSFGGSKS